MHHSYQMPRELLLASELDEARAPCPQRGQPTAFSAEYRGNKELYIQITVSAFANDYRVIACIGPAKPDAAICKLPRNQWEDYQHTLADLRHKTAPRYLHALTDIIARNVEGAAPLGKAPNHSPYAPDGPWEYLPPIHAFDWRTRARRLVPKEPFEHLPFILGPCNAVAVELLDRIDSHNPLRDLPWPGRLASLDLTAPQRPPRNSDWWAHHFHNKDYVDQG
jgi:hypothetical protein